MSSDKPGASDAAIGWAMILAVVGACLYLFWVLFEEQIKSVFRWIKYGEMWLVSWFVGDDYTVQWGEYSINFQEWFEATPNIPPENLDAQTLSIISTVALTPYKWLFIALLLAMGIWALRRGPGTQHREKFDVHGLIGAQAQNFPVITPFVNFNPSEQPPRPPGSPVPAELPLFGEALGPEEWLAYNSIPVPDGKIDADSVHDGFTKQLGPRWKGAKNLEDYKKVILACFCLKASRKRDRADEMLGRLAMCWTHDKGLNLKKDKTLLSEARQILSDKELSAKTLSKCNRHAWETTAIMRALLTAREEGGVMAPAQFVWLRGHDRTLWYPLNNLGRNSYHMEALGAMCHYKAEKLADRPVPKPKLDDAVSSIIGYMESDNARPIPQLDYSQSKKRGIKKVKTS